MITSIIKNRGFTLVETLIYSFGVVLLLGIIATSLFYAYRWYDSALISSRVDQMGESVASRLTNDLRSAISVNTGQSAFDVANGSISIETKVSTSSTMDKRYALAGGRITYQENADPADFLTPQGFQVTRFKLISLSSPVSKAINFEFDIAYTDRLGPKTSTYAGLAIFRNSYE